MDDEHTEIWAKQLIRSKIYVTAQNCVWDNGLKTIIHKFDRAARTCQCKKVIVEEKITSGGWKRIPQKNSE